LSERDFFDLTGFNNTYHSDDVSNFLVPLESTFKDVQINLQSIIKKEKNLKEKLLSSKTGVDKTTKIKEKLLKLSEDRQKVQKHFNQHLKKGNLITGSLAVHATHYSQYIFYFGKDGSLHQLRNSVREIKGEEKQTDSSWRDWIFDIAKSTAKPTIFSWTKKNLFEDSNIQSDILAIVGYPISNYTTLGSQYVFFLDYPSFHIHELVWSTNALKWKHNDITLQTESPSASPSSRIFCHSTSTSQYIYFLNSHGNIQELSQNFLSTKSNWVSSNIHNQKKDLPLAVQIFSCTSLPLNRKINSTVIYYKDKASHIIELVCNRSITSTTWNFRDLFTQCEIANLVTPKGGLLVYTKGILESLSIAVHSIYNNIYNLISSKEEQITIEEENSKKMIARIEHETQKLREQTEATEKIQVEIIKIQQKYQDLYKNHQEKIVAIEEYRNKLEENEKLNRKSEDKAIEYQRKLLEEETEMGLYREEINKLRKEQERIEKEKKENEIQILNVTGGLGYDVWKKIHLQSQPDEDACVVCLDFKPNVKIEDCKHQVVCEICIKKIMEEGGRICPNCRAPITKFTVLEK